MKFNKIKFFCIKFDAVERGYVRKVLEIDGKKVYFNIYIYIYIYIKSIFPSSPRP